MLISVSGQAMSVKWQGSTNDAFRGVFGSFVDDGADCECLNSDCIDAETITD